MAVSWNELSEEQQQQYYPAAVRSTFGCGDTRPEVIDALLVPPMKSLESVQVEVTTFCNFACQQCTRTKLMAEGKWVNSHISLETYETIIKKLPRAYRVILQGVGEPSLHPNFEDLIRIALATGKYGIVAFNTNGHSHNEAFWRALGQKYRLSVSLSIDSLDQRVATICRKGTDVETLYRQMCLFKDIFAAFSVTMVASRLNFEDIPATLRMIATAGVRQVGIQGMITEEGDLVLDAGQNRELAEHVRVIGAEYPGFQIYGAGGSGHSGISSGLERCVAPFVAPFITAKGDLAPCCAAIEPAAYDWTSLLDERDWNAIRSSPGVINWIRSYVAEDPPMCRTCSFNPRRASTAANGRPRRDPIAQ